MGLQIDRLNTCCPVFGNDKVGDRVNQIITRVEDAKALMNAHTHAAVNTAPNTVLMSSPDVTALVSPADMNLICSLGTLQFGTKLAAIVTLANELDAVFNVHGHTAFGVIATEQLVSAALPVITAAQQLIMDGVCISMGDPAVGTKIQDLTTLLIEIVAAHNTHVHPAVITAVTDQTIASASVSVLV